MKEHEIDCHASLATTLVRRHRPPSCHREERSDVAIHRLPRFARNDEFRAMHTKP